MLRIISTFIFLVLTAAMFDLNAIDIKPLENGPINEAFISKAMPDVLLQAISEQPPEQILEKIPPQTDTQTIWIPGYFAWDESRGDFIWISGVWRRPPPGHTWIKGFWKNYEDGWVWIPGFWSPVSENLLSYIPASPPNSIDESVNSPQNPDFFWDPGYWIFNKNSTQYEWVSGKWIPFDPNWVLVPAHYVWRPEGYIFIPPYWDWPINKIGTAYNSVFIDPEIRLDYIYTPEFILQDVVIMERCLPYYPDYICYFQSHLHYNPNFWIEFCCTPPWWAWDTWWCFNWHDQWGLWWWYLHPGFPQPVWMNAKLAGHIPRPTGKMHKLLRNINAPAIITRRGINTTDRIEGSIRKVTNRSVPVIPAERIRRNRIIDQEIPSKQRGTLRPSGRRSEFNPRIPIPNQPMKPAPATKERVPLAPERVIPHIPKPERFTQPSRPERVPGWGQQRPPSFPEKRPTRPSRRSEPKYPERNSGRITPEGRTDSRTRRPSAPSEIQPERKPTNKTPSTDSRTRRPSAPSEIQPERARIQTPRLRPKIRKDIIQPREQKIKDVNDNHRSKITNPQDEPHTESGPHGRSFESTAPKGPRGSAQPPSKTPRVRQRNLSSEPSGKSDRRPRNIQSPPVFKKNKERINWPNPQTK